MPSPYFANYTGAVETTLLEDLMNEIIYLNGFSGYYIPRTDAAIDLIYGDSPLKKFTNSYKMDMYLIHSSTVGDEGDFFSKFGLEVRDSIKIQFTTREFAKYVPSYMKRPNEGDLIYIPFQRNTGELYEIKFVNTTKDLNVLARSTPYYYELSLEPFKYNDEQIDTGIAEIDNIEVLFSYNNTLQLYSGNGTFVVAETVYQGANSNSHIAIAEVSKWDAANAILTVINISGEFSATSNLRIIGETSGANYSLSTSTNRYQNNEFDNDQIIDEYNQFAIISDTNPLGSL